MFLLQGKYRPLVGLDITTSSIKLIELSMSGGQYRVEAYAAEPTPQNAVNEQTIVDSEAVGEAVKRCIKRSGTRSREGRDCDQRRCGHHQGDPDAQEPAGRGSGGPGGNAGRSVHPLPHGRGQL
ncbi:MAG: pilus assembly protein PilM [Steroidobacteraceae bacterium]